MSNSKLSKRSRGRKQQGTESASRLPDQSSALLTYTKRGSDKVLMDASPHFTGTKMSSTISSGAPGSDPLYKYTLLELYASFARLSICAVHIIPDHSVPCNTMSLTVIRFVGPELVLMRI